MQFRPCLRHLIDVRKRRRQIKHMHALVTRNMRVSPYVWSEVWTSQLQNPVYLQKGYQTLILLKQKFKKISVKLMKTSNSVYNFHKLMCLSTYDTAYKICLTCLLYTEKVL